MAFLSMEWQVPRNYRMRAFGYLKVSAVTQYCWHLINGLVQDCGISNANVLEIPHSCTNILLQAIHLPLRTWTVTLLSTVHQRRSLINSTFAVVQQTLQMFPIRTPEEQHADMSITRQYGKIQSSAVIMRSKIIRYCINLCRNWGGLSIRCWIDWRQPIPHPRL